MLKRLFPFQRGLLHSYWAGNIWALYSFLDKGFKFLLGARSKTFNQSSLGVTQDTMFDFLPQISPHTTILLILLSLLPLAISIWKNPKKTFFPYYLSYAIFAFFFFGFHVHEKALLMVSVIYASQAINDPQTITIALLLRVSTSISMFPLLIRINGIVSNSSFRITY